MNKSKFKLNDRVVDSYLGAGTIIAVFNRDYLVKMDIPPDAKYNFGKTRCMCFEDNLTPQPPPADSDCGEKGK